MSPKRSSGVSGKLNIEFQTLSSVELNRIKPLWQELNKHHLEKSADFKDHYRYFTFEERIKVLVVAEKQLYVRIAVNRADGGMVGYCVSSIDAERTGRIESLYIRKGFRKFGIGGTLVKEALRYFQSNGMLDVTVDVAAGNEEAFAYYACFSFAPRMHVLKLK